MRGEGNEVVAREASLSLRWFLFCVWLGFIYFFCFVAVRGDNSNEVWNAYMYLGKDGLAGT